MAVCQCGCGEEIIQKRAGRYSKYIHNHYWRGKQRSDRAKPESTNWRTLRWRAHSLISTEKCAMEHIGGCKGRVDVHHIDKNYCNNDLSNLAAVCGSHHRLLDNRRITMESTSMPEFYTDASGKRRYRKRIA